MMFCEKFNSIKILLNSEYCHKADTEVYERVHKKDFTMKLRMKIMQYIMF